MIYFVSKCSDYSTVITTLQHITVNSVCIIFTAPYSKVRSTLGFQVCLSVLRL